MKLMPRYLHTWGGNKIFQGWYRKDNVRTYLGGRKYDWCAINIKQELQPRIIFGTKDSPMLKAAVMCKDTRQAKGIYKRIISASKRHKVVTFNKITTKEGVNK